MSAPTRLRDNPETDFRSGQVHADATNFGGNLSKDEVYKMLLLQAKGLLDGQRNWV